MFARASVRAIEKSSHIKRGVAPVQSAAIFGFFIHMANVQP